MPTFIKALMDFFSQGRYGRKVEISEFQGLTEQDKIDLSREMLEAGIDHTPYTGKKPTE